MRALGITGLSLLASACLLLDGCSESVPEPLQLKVGVHNITLDAPPGWQHLEDDVGNSFKREFAQILLNDTGPVTVEKFRRETERAREVFRRGELGQANDILNGLPLRSYFPGIERWQNFADSLNRARNLGTGLSHHDPDAIERAYTEILLQIGTLQNRDIVTLATEALAEHEALDRREIATQRALIIDQKSALLIDTWDRLNHTGRKRYIFVMNDGNFLVIRTGLGVFSDVEPSFEDLVASVRFRGENN